ncbi:MAG: carbohydrate binding domain-containing protein [Oscillospiraceae bacterium]|nr:carbohydrate binding domain-containing protein [Oscillospiraceae bacterium]
MRKRLFICFLAFGILLSLAGCAKKSSSRSSKQELDLAEYYYRSDEDEYEGQFYWIYHFSGGMYRAQAYTPYGQAITYQNVWEVMEDGTYSISGSRLTLDPKGSIAFRSTNYVTASKDYTYTLKADGDNMTDENGNVYYRGKPWTENPAYETPVVLADSYAEQSEKWNVWIDQDAGAEAEVYLGDEEQDYDLYIDVTDTGSDPWSIQAKYEGLRLEQGSKYHVSFEYYIQTNNYVLTGYDHTKHKGYYVFQHNGDDYTTYLEEPLTLTQQELYTTVNFTFIMTEPTDDNVFFGINAGGLGNTGANVSIKKLLIEKLS